MGQLEKVMYMEHIAYSTTLAKHLRNGMVCVESDVCVPYLALCVILHGSSHHLESLGLLREKRTQRQMLRFLFSKKYYA